MTTTPPPPLPPCPAACAPTAGGDGGSGAPLVHGQPREPAAQAVGQPGAAEHLCNACGRPAGDRWVGRGCQVVDKSHSSTSLPHRPVEAQTTTHRSCGLCAHLSCLPAHLSCLPAAFFVQSSCAGSGLPPSEIGESAYMGASDHTHLLFIFSNYTNIFFAVGPWLWQHVQETVI